MLIILSARLVMKTEIVSPSLYSTGPLMIRQLGGNYRTKINN